VIVVVVEVSVVVLTVIVCVGVQVTRSVSGWWAGTCSRFDIDSRLRRGCKSRLEWG
jgi:hypothetical protein